MSSSATSNCFVTAENGLSVFATQKEAFDNALVNNDKFFFAVDKGTAGKKEYGSCQDSKTFLNFYTDYEPKCFYELLHENSPVYEYYDIDLKAVENTLNKKPEQIFLRFDSIRKDFIQKEFGKPVDTDWRITDSSKIDPITGNWKVSLHLVNKACIWAENSITKGWYKALQTYIKKFYNEELFDPAVDSKNRAMRIILSCKASDLKRPLQQAIWKHTCVQLPVSDFLIQAPSTPLNVELSELFKYRYESYEKEVTDLKKYYKDQNAQRLTVEKKLTVSDILDEDDDPVERMISLITEQIKLGKHSLCDTQVFGKMKYPDFRDLCFAYLSTFTEFNDSSVFSFIETEIWPYYRSSGDYKPEAVLNSIINSSKQNGDRTNKFTIKSLHYWSRENPDYKTYFSKKEVQHTLSVFNEDEHFYWGDFINIIISTVFDTQEDLEKYVIENINKVCVVIQEDAPVFFLKMESSIKAYTLKSTNAFGYNCKFQGKKTEETLKLDVIVKSNLNLIRRHNCFVYRPYGCTIPNIKDEIFNTFTGFKAKLKPSSLLQKPELKCDLILKHIREVLCAGDDNKYDYFLTWLSHIVQFPEKKTKVMLILYSECQQVGKGILAEKLITSVFGTDNSSKTCSINDLVGDFNSMLSNKVFMVIDEANNDIVTNSKVQKLKSIITDQVQTTQKKYFDADQCIDYSNFMMLTNEANAMRIESKDKRTCVFKVSDHRVSDRKYFQDLNDQLEDSEAIDYFYTFLFNYKSNRHILDIPETAEKREMMNLTAEQPIKFFNDVKEQNYEINERYITRLKEGQNKGAWINVECLYDQFNDWVVRNGEKTGIYSLIKFNRFAKNQLGDFTFFNADRKRKFNIESISPNL